jgi:uncharacterized membrane protein
MHRTIGELAMHVLQKRLESLGERERRVLESAVERKPISKDSNKAFVKQLTYGQKVADSIARIGGSWTFIISFLVFLLLWTVGNTILLSRHAFDPYPYIFLNLVLSMLAAIQAPVIMMSQNRQSEHDRIDAEHDYEVNLKAEIEIMALHEKLDSMRTQEIMVILERIEALAGRMEQFERAALSRPSKS